MKRRVFFASLFTAPLAAQNISPRQVRGGLSLAKFHDAEVPGGTPNGNLVSFTLAVAPNPPASLELYCNGVLQEPASDYTLSGAAIAFTAASVPQTGDTLLAWYRA